MRHLCVVLRTQRLGNWASLPALRRILENGYKLDIG